MKNPELLRIGTRASKLALAQAHEVKTRLMAAYGMAENQFEIVPMTTTGDRVQDKTLATIGGKGLFTKEIEDALLSGQVDIAVHSMKDMPTVLPDGLEIGCLLEREDPRDAWLSPIATSLAELPKGARIGTSSLRRAAQVLHARPDIQIVPMRGNVGTRIKKLEEGQCEATLLAVAGLKRLGLGHLITAPLPVDTCLPAIAQGAIGVEIRSQDVELKAWLRAINHGETELAVAAERSLLKTLDGSCRTPIGGLATIENGTLLLEGLLAEEDGTKCLRLSGSAPADMESAIRLGKNLGKALLEKR